MKNLLSITVCVLLLASVTSVHAEETPAPEGAPTVPGGAIVQDRVGEIPRVPIEPPEEPEAHVFEGIQPNPLPVIPSEDQGVEAGVVGDRDHEYQIVDRNQDVGSMYVLSGDTQQPGVDHCEGMQRIPIGPTNRMTARAVFEEELKRIWGSSGFKRIACFDFKEPIVLETPLEIRPEKPISIKLVGMQFEASPDFSKGARGGVEALVHVINMGGKLELIDLNIMGNAEGEPIDACLHIENSENVAVQRGSLSHCIKGAVVFNSKQIHFGAYDNRFAEADGVYIGKNLETGLWVRRSEMVTFGYNRFDSNVKIENDEGVLIFDYYNAVELGTSSNGNIQPPDKMPLGPDDDELFMKVTAAEGQGGVQYINMKFSNPPGIIHLYSAYHGQVSYLGSCELGEDRDCVALISRTVHTTGTQITAIYTSSALQASSEFMDPIEWHGGTVVTPPTEFVMTTPAPEAEDDLDLGAGGSAQMVGGEAGGGGAPAPKMCSMSVYADASYSPLMWLFLSIGLLGSARLYRRK